MRQENLFLLRVWRDGDRSEDWRASATDLRSKRIIRFASLAALHQFLDEQNAGVKEDVDHESVGESSPSPYPEKEK